MMGRLKVVPLKYQPGKGWHYSFGTEVLARVIEVASGQSLDVCLAKRVIEPLGMKDTAFYVPAEKRNRFAVMYGRRLKPADAPQPGTAGPFNFEKAPKFLSAGGGLVSTATDYMRFCLMLANKGELDGKRLLKTETVEEMIRNQLPKGVGEITRRPKGRGFALGFAVRIRKIDSAPSSIGEYEWLGGGGTEFWISPRDELVVITLTQRIPMINLGQILKPVVYGAIADKEIAKRNRYLLLDSRIVESTDAVKWTRSKLIIEGTPLKQAHDMVIFRHGGVYLGLLGMMHYPSMKSKDGVRQHIELAWSGDSYTWHRISPGTPLIGPTRARETKYGKMPYDWGCIFPSTPIFRDGEIQIYYGACDWYFFDWRKSGLAMARLRPDGWAGYEQIDGTKPATITTTPVVCTGDRLQLSADVSKGGSVKVTLLDKDSNQLAVGKPIRQTVTDAEVNWPKGFSLEKLKANQIRLRFQVSRAKLYSFSFSR